MRLSLIRTMSLAVVTIGLSLGSLPHPAHAQTWGQGDAAPTTGDCDPGVQQHEDALARQATDAYTQLASSLYTPMPASGFDGVSCLGNLMSGNLNLIFNPPSISSILSSLMNGVCSYVTNLATEQISSITQSVSGLAGSQLPIGDIIPGVNLGSDIGGVSMQPSGSGGFSVNGAPVTGNLAGFWGDTTPTVNSYGALFGSAGQ